MAKRILVNLTTGPENPSRAAIAFFMARLMQEDGHEVTMFLAAEGVQMGRRAAIDNVKGLGTGDVKENHAVFLEKGGKIYASKMSSAMRGFTEEEARDASIELTAPTTLARLITEVDQVVVY